MNLYEVNTKEDMYPTRSIPIIAEDFERAIKEVKGQLLLDHGIPQEQILSIVLVHEGIIIKS